MDKETEINTISKETELKDSWRYIPVGIDTWKLEVNLKSPEDDYINKIDGLIREEERPSGIEMISSLSEIEKKIVYYYLWEGLSFFKIGKALGFTKQRAHQIYHSAIKNLKENIKNGK